VSNCSAHASGTTVALRFTGAGPTWLNHASSPSHPERPSRPPRQKARSRRGLRASMRVGDSTDRRFPPFVVRKKLCAASSVGTREPGVIHATGWPLLQPPRAQPRPPQDPPREPLAQWSRSTLAANLATCPPQHRGDPHSPPTRYPPRTHPCLALRGTAVARQGVTRRRAGGVRAYRRSSSTRAELSRGVSGPVRRTSARS
jgi:hypothetical protein